MVPVLVARSSSDGVAIRYSISCFVDDVMFLHSDASLMRPVYSLTAGALQTTEITAPNFLYIALITSPSQTNL